MLKAFQERSGGIGSLYRNCVEDGYSMAGRQISGREAEGEGPAVYGQVAENGCEPTWSVIVLHPDRRRGSPRSG